MSYLTQQEKLSSIDPEFELIWASRPSTGNILSSIHERRERTNGVIGNLVDGLGAFAGEVEDIYIPVRDGHSIDGRVWRPPQTTGQQPLVVWYHGGGFCMGDISMNEPLCRRVCSDLKCVVIATNAAPLGANPATGFIVGGSSAGANISIVLSHLARDSKIIPALTGVYLGIPLVVHHDAVPPQYLTHYKSFAQNKDAPILNEESIRFLAGQLQPVPSDPLYSPLLWPTGHKDLPPTYFQVCGLDPVRDDGLIYEDLLRRECGVETKIDVYPGVPHGFNSAFPSLKSSRKFENDGMEGIKWLLERQYP
ncbi:Alpha/Beta hydrolase protein [Leptodontidium sp. MPI-SDFR-AT-0119]|nr:Alpha/Beta hydrolase protein [Leptodontidium sp. MPI-SDFR-AT-0119]